MDILYIFRHSVSEDWELRFSLRSVNLYLPYIRKIWILGDRPSFLVDDRALIEHVPHDYVAWIGRYREPVKNLFLNIFLGSLLPGLSEEFILFCDDYFLLDYVPAQRMRKDRVLENLDDITGACGRGLWKDALWRTYDLLKRLGYPGHNFEAHCPAYFTKQRVWDAFREFRDFVTEDYYHGVLAHTAILNYAAKHGAIDLELMTETKPKATFVAPAAYDEIRSQCDGKLFLNFNEDGLNDDMRRFLGERFPVASIYERPHA